MLAVTVYIYPVDIKIGGENWSVALFLKWRIHYQLFSDLHMLQNWNSDGFLSTFFKCRVEDEL